MSAVANFYWAETVESRHRVMTRNPPSSFASGDDGTRIVAVCMYENEAEMIARALNGLRLYTSAEFAEHVGLARVTVNKLAASGKIGRKIGRDWVFTGEDVETVKSRGVNHVAGG